MYVILYMFKSMVSKPYLLCKMAQLWGWSHSLYFQNMKSHYPFSTLLPLHNSSYCALRSNTNIVKKVFSIDKITYLVLLPTYISLKKTM